MPCFHAVADDVSSRGARASSPAGASASAGASHHASSSGSALERGAGRGTTRRFALRAFLTAPLAPSLATRLAASLAALPAAVPLLAVAGCGMPADAVPATRARPDVSVLRAAIAAKKEMIALYTAVRTVHPALTPQLQHLVKDNAAHLTELERRLIGHPAGAKGRVRARPGPPPGAGTAVVPPTRAAALAALRSAEHSAAAVHVKQLKAVTPSLAQLLASIAACEATHAAALRGHGLTP